MKYKKWRYFVGDFETTVYEGQEFTEVWASACVELGSEDVKIFHTIDDTFLYLSQQDSNVICYYHNLKFDGTFWLNYLLGKLKFKEAINEAGWIEDKYMPNNTFKYTISDMGQWYDVTIKFRGHIIQLRDSLKLLPFTVKRIGESFGTKHKKLDMEYKGYRFAGCEITDEEKKYIANDVLVVKEALEIMFAEGHNRMTIGSCCLNEFKKLTFHDKYEYEGFYPDLYEVEIDENKYGTNNAGEYIRKSYKGGWCYVVKGKETTLYHNGVTADVNSLYPSMMSSESGNIYPMGLPTFWKGNYIPDEALQSFKFFFIRIKTRFYIKPNMLPFIQIKHSFLYDPTEYLESSDVYNPEDGKYYDHYYWGEELRDTRVELTLTQTDYKLLLEHYELVDFEILDGCYFVAQKGVFDRYIEKYKKIKMESKGAKRELAKLFLNNLYGKMASSKNSSYKVAYINDEGGLSYKMVEEYKKKAGYIAVGSAITSYARNFTIRTAQKNYYGKDKRGFIYADTDSIHCDLKPEELVDVPVHPTAFCHWKLESCWDTGWFVRQKTYIEHIVAEDLEPIEKPYYNVKCAGMPPKCKDLFIKSMEGYVPKPEDEFTAEELDFISKKRDITDFNIGLTVVGKLMAKQIKGGTLLVDTTFEMR